MIDLCNFRTKGRRPCGALRASASALVHGDRLDDGAWRFAVNHQMSRHPRGGPDSAPLPECSPRARGAHSHPWPHLRTNGGAAGPNLQAALALRRLPESLFRFAHIRQCVMRISPWSHVDAVCTLWFCEAVYRAGRRILRVGPSLLPLDRARGSDLLSPLRYP